MKLLIENWRKYLTESQKEPGLLYHATLSSDGGRSFIENGIDSQRSGGFGQGAGFYLWSDRESAQRYIKGLLHGMTGGTAGSKEEEVSGDPIIVVVDEPVIPQNFDIDYEVYAKGFINFVKNNIDYFRQNGDALGIRVRDLDDGLSVNRKILGTGNKYNMIANWMYPEEWESDHHSMENIISLEDGRDLGVMAAKLHELDPAKYDEFEKQTLPKARALKYNGKTKIQPLRIEDVKGKVLWSRE